MTTIPMLSIVGIAIVNGDGSFTAGATQRGNPSVVKNPGLGDYTVTFNDVSMPLGDLAPPILALFNSGALFSTLQLVGGAPIAWQVFVFDTTGTPADSSFGLTIPRQETA